MSIDLTRFCANERDVREYLQRPFEIDGFVYATNGHMAVRVPAADYPGQAQYTPGKHPKQIVQLFADAAADADKAQPLPIIQEPADCSLCKGTGIMPEHLADIEAQGPEDCASCGGSGKTTSVTDINGTTYADHYLYALQQILPPFRIATRGMSKPAYIDFDGGCALLMPCRP